MNAGDGARRDRRARGGRPGALVVDASEKRGGRGRRTSADLIARSGRPADPRSQQDRPDREAEAPADARRSSPTGFDFRAIVPISALTGDGVDRLYGGARGESARGRGGLPGGLPDRDDRDRSGSARSSARSCSSAPATSCPSLRGRRRVGAGGRREEHDGRDGVDRRRARGAEGHRGRQGRDDDPRDRQGGARGARGGARPEVLSRADGEGARADWRDDERFLSQLVEDPGGKRS